MLIRLAGYARTVAVAVSLLAPYAHAQDAPSPEKPLAPSAEVPADALPAPAVAPLRCTMESGTSSEVGAFDTRREDMDFDAQGRLLRVEVGPQETCMLRGTSGGCQKGPAGPVTLYRYQNGKLHSASAAGRTLYTLSYDATGRFERIVHTPTGARKETRGLIYAADGSVATITAHVEGGKAANTQSIVHRIDSARRTTHMARFAQSVDLTYGASGKPEKVVLTRPGPHGKASPVVTTITYTWDAAGRLTKESSCSGAASCAWFEARYRADGSIENAAIYLADGTGKRESIWAAAFSAACGLTIEPPSPPEYPSLPNDLRRSYLDSVTWPVFRVVALPSVAQTPALVARPAAAPRTKPAVSPGKAPPP